MRLFLSGITITTVSWIFAWGNFGIISEYSFFPLWLGFILTVNGLSEILFDKSLLSKMGAGFICLFIISIPFWWIFEFFNLFTKNWVYVLPNPQSSVAYIFRASLNFSTVIPSVLSTIFLFQKSLKKIKDFEIKKFKVTKSRIFSFLQIGIISSLLIFIYPQTSYPLVWISPALVFDSLNYLFGFPSIIRSVSRGKITSIITVFLSTLLTGFFWEMWNYYSFPKWKYTIPYLGFNKIFEMPVLGYLGYPVFGFGLVAFSYLSFGIIRKVLKLPIKFDLLL